MAESDTDANEILQAEDDSMLEDVGVCLAVGIGGLLATALWASVLVSIVLAVAGDSEISDVGLVLLSPPTAALGYATASGVYVHVAEDGLSFIDLSVPSLRDLGYVVGGTLALFLAVQGIGFLFAQFGVTTSQHGTIDTLQNADPRVSLFMVAAALLFIGPGEELLFRNVIQKRLYRSFSRPGAILVGSVVFAIVHYQSYASGTPGQVLASLAVVFALSLLLGWIYHRTESVVVPALVHGGYDAILFGAVYVDVVGGL